MKRKRFLVLSFLLALSLFTLPVYSDEIIINPTEHIEDGRIYLKKGEYEEAIVDFQIAIDQLEEYWDIPDDEGARETLVIAYHWLATAYTKNNMPQKAKEVYKRILEISPLDVKTRKKLDRMKREKEIESKLLKKESAHFTLKFEGTQEREYEAPEILAILEGAYKRVGTDLDYYPKAKTTVIIYPSREKFRYVTDTHYWTGGLYDGKIRIPLSIELDEAEHFKRTLVHEYTHHVIHGKTKDNCPSWLHEGLAQYEDRSYEENQEKDEKRLETLTSELEKNMLVPLKYLGPHWKSKNTKMVKMAYYEAYTATKYLIGRYGLKGISRLLKKMGEGVSMNKALEEVFHLDYQALDKKWHEFLAQGEPFVARRPTQTKRGAAVRDEASTLYSLAQNYEMNKMYDLAIGEYQKIIKNYPDSVWAQKARERIKAIDTKRR